MVYICIFYTSHKNRVFINDAKTRDIIKTYCKETISPKQFQDLKMKLKIFQPALLPLFQDLENSNHQSKCPNELKEFLKAIASNYPICQFLHYNKDLFDLLEKISEGYQFNKTSADSIFLLESCPVLARFLSGIPCDSPIIKPLLIELIEVARSPYETTQSHNLEACNDCNCHNEKLGYFPTLPKMSHRGDYKQDAKNTASAGETKCSKTGAKHPSLSPGLFTLSCIHGISLSH